ncbi:MAG: hypothetical protein IJX51_03815 [Clostridia bacterium]|nr:hypothetical protein [Clostridia bacterium]
MAERIFAIEYFNGKINKFGGQISKEKVFNLTEDIINQELNYFGVSSLIGTVDNFKVRGWSGKNDFDGLLTEKNDNIVISILK